METPRFTLKREKFAVELDDGNGNIKKIFVQEMSGAGRSEYLAAMQSHLKIDFDSGNLTGIKSFKGLHALLLKYTLVTDDGQPIPEDVFLAYPGNLLEFLFDKSREINRFTKKGQPGEKKDSQAKS